MIKIKNNVISTPINEILMVLLKELKFKGINYLRTLRVIGNNVQTCCPYHNGGKERSPSSGVLLVDNDRSEAGTFHCFACGKTSTLQELISYCFGYDDGGIFGEDWLIENFKNSLVLTRYDTLKTILDNNEKTIVGEIKGVEESELSSYRFIHPYMYKRKLTDKIISEFDVGYDVNTDCITFPTCDKDGKCLFVTRRHVEKKFYHMPIGVKKPVYGLDKITINMREVVVCESIINALTLWTWGIPAIALLGTGTKEQYEILRNTQIRTFILAFDGDDAGYKATNRFIMAVKNKIIFYYILPSGKDINDLTYEEYKKLEKRGV